MRNTTPSLLLTFLCLLSLSSAAQAQDKKVLCMYRDETGKTLQTNMPDSIPPKYRSGAKCFYETDKAANQLAAPSDVRLEGSQREEDMNTGIGRIHLRWERKSEKLFGRTPVRAMSDAANTLSRVLKNPAFPSKLQDLNQEWFVVFLGDNIPAGQIPMHLITNCHPGWMTPPSNIYIVSDRVAGGCGAAHSSSSVADSTLTEVLLHEFGHAVEFQLLNGQDIAGDRMRAEGFATFFAGVAARSSSVANASHMEEQQKALAKQSIQSSPNGFNFQGSAQDYARAAMYFISLEQKLGLRAVTQLYEVMHKKSLGFFAAIQDSVGWDDKRREKEIRSYLKIS